MNFITNYNLIKKKTFNSFHFQSSHDHKLRYLKAYVSLIKHNLEFWCLRKQSVELIKINNII
jgi:hypothetical protein